MAPALVNELARRWAAGQSTGEIATYLGVTSASAGTKISNLRARFPDRFPRRRKKTLQRLSYCLKLLRAVHTEHRDPRLAEVIEWMEQKAKKHPATSRNRP